MSLLQVDANIFCLLYIFVGMFYPNVLFKFSIFNILLQLFRCIT